MQDITKGQRACSNSLSSLDINRQSLIIDVTSLHNLWCHPNGSMKAGVTLGPTAPILSDLDILHAKIILSGV